MIGVYEIRNTVTGKAYIGASTDVKKRWINHRWKLRYQRHQNSSLQADWQKYGEESFSFSVLIEGVEREDLGQLEQDYIDNRKSLYNVNEDVYDFTRTRIHSEETRRRMSEANKGKEVSDETRRRLSDAQKGKTHSEETKAKMTAAQCGEKAPLAKLTWEKVREIRRLYTAGDTTQRQLGRQFGVTQRTIGYIVNSKTWIEE